MRYSQEFKNQAVSRFLSKELTFSETLEQYSISKSSLYKWVKAASEEAGGFISEDTGKRKIMAKLKLPKGVTYLKAHAAVVCRDFMSESDFGQFCRKHGYLASSVEEWAQWFKNHPDAADKKECEAQAGTICELRRENARQAREIARKDKALADAATMLMLSKKAEAIWGRKDN